MPTFNGNEYSLTGYLADVSTAGQIFIVAPDAGEIVKIASVINGTIATADVDFTAKIGGTAVTGGVITATASGSAAGDVDSTVPTAANSVTAGQAIEIETDGASTNTVEAWFTVTIRR